MAAVKDLLDDWVNVWNTYDLNHVDGLFLDSSDTTYFSSEKEGVIVGLDAIREHHRGFGFVEGGKDHGNRLWLENTTTTNLGPTAVISSIWFFEKATGDVMRGPVTFVCAEREGAWEFVHVHFANYGR